MFGLLDDIDRQDVKDFLNSAVDNTADLYDTVTEYDYSNMFDDIGDYFRGLLSDEPASPMSSRMGAAFGSRGGGRVMSPTATRQKNIERLLQERQGLYSMGGEPQSITKTTVSVSPGTQPMMMPQRIKDAEMRRRGAEDIRLQYPEFDMMMQMNRPRRAKLSESFPVMQKVSPERRQLAAFASRNPGGMRNAPDYGSEMTKVQPARAYGLISPEDGDFLSQQATELAQPYFDRLRGF